MRELLVLTLAGAALSPGQAAAQTLNLVCSGTVPLEREDLSGSMSAKDDFGYSAKGHISSTHVEQVPEQARLELREDGTGRIFMPKTMTAGLLKSYGVDGWHEIERLNRTDSEITGKIRYGLMAGGGMTIDRITGRISITGWRSFAGECRAYDPAERKF